MLMLGWPINFGSILTLMDKNTRAPHPGRSRYLELLWLLFFFFLQVAGRVACTPRVAQRYKPPWEKRQKEKQTSTGIRDSPFFVAWWHDKHWRWTFSVYWWAPLQLRDLLSLCFLHGCVAVVLLLQSSRNTSSEIQLLTRDPTATAADPFLLLLLPALTKLWLCVLLCGISSVHPLPFDSHFHVKWNLETRQGGVIGVRRGSLVQ